MGVTLLLSSRISVGEIRHDCRAAISFSVGPSNSDAGSSTRSYGMKMPISLRHSCTPGRPMGTMIS